MRILFVHENYGFWGGVEQNIAETVQGLTERGHICFFAYGKRTDRDVDRFGDLFSESLSCREISGNMQDSGFLDYVDRLQPDVIYLHKVPDISFVLPCKGKIRLVRMIHDHDVCCPRRHKYYALSGKVCHHGAGWRCYLDLAFLTTSGSSRQLHLTSLKAKFAEMRRNHELDACLVGSRFMETELLQNGFAKERVHIVPPAVHTDVPPPSEVPDTPNLLFVGQWTNGKGVTLLMEALRYVNLPFQLTMVGAGNATPQIKALREKYQLNDKVILQGWVSHDDIGRFYDEARMLVVPVRWPEPFGMIGLEAMLHARPTVAFNVGGIPDWLEHEKTGLLVAEQDLKGFALSIERLLKDHELAKRMGQAAFKYVQEHYSFKIYLDRMEQILGLPSQNTPQ